MYFIMNSYIKSLKTYNTMQRKVNVVQIKNKLLVF